LRLLPVPVGLRDRGGGHHQRLHRGAHPVQRLPRVLLPAHGARVPGGGALGVVVGGVAQPERRRRGAAVRVWGHRLRGERGGPPGGGDRGPVGGGDRRATGRPLRRVREARPHARPQRDAGGPRHVPALVRLVRVQSRVLRPDPGALPGRARPGELDRGGAHGGDHRTRRLHRGPRDALRPPAVGGPLGRAGRVQRALGRVRGHHLRLRRGRALGRHSLRVLRRLGADRAQQARVEAMVRRPTGGSAAARRVRGVGAHLHGPVRQGGAGGAGVRIGRGGREPALRVAVGGRVGAALGAGGRGGGDRGVGEPDHGAALLRASQTTPAEDIGGRGAGGAGHLQPWRLRICGAPGGPSPTILRGLHEHRGWDSLTQELQRMMDRLVGASSQDGSRFRWLLVPRVGFDSIGDDECAIM
ncbi:ammonium transporter 1 member, partial [Musa troglodytarum]